MRRNGNRRWPPEAQGDRQGHTVVVKRILAMGRYSPAKPWAGEPRLLGLSSKEGVVWRSNLVGAKARYGPV